MEDTLLIKCPDFGVHYSNYMQAEPLYQQSLAIRKKPWAKTPHKKVKRIMSSF